MASHILVDTDSVQTILNKTLTTPVISSPALSGTSTGTYTIGGTPTVTAPTITGILTIAGQIKFPAIVNQSSDVNTLDDYEEGVFTPSLGGNTTYTTQVGTYIKIGPLVFIDIQLTINVLGTGNTSVISGLPFIASRNTILGIGTATTLAVSPVSLHGAVTSASSTITIAGRVAAAASSSTQAVFGNGASIVLAGFYPTAS